MVMAKDMGATEENHILPDVRKIKISDVIVALKGGIADFNQKPTHYLFLIITYPILMILIARTAAGYDVLPMLFPIIAGSTLLGPVAACGMYELSRRMETGQDTRWTHVFDVFKSPSILAIITLGVILGSIFIMWLAASEMIYAHFFGNAVPSSIGGFIEDVLTTSAGWGMIVAGVGVGFIFAAIVLTISVVSFPYLLDHKSGPMIALMVSVKAVAANPKPMAFWGLIVAVSLFLGALPAFLGLAVIMPVLGHATWHLYRKVVVS
ncbi:hypothetical protein A9Q83_05510 [Alphaproteobacteria bacterium 46_93_T64]|nr:hypothetical protein A9Q83_05510 [Alphaproteobacteria bacterium 46_93_T64]